MEDRIGIRAGFRQVLACLCSFHNLQGYAPVFRFLQDLFRNRQAAVISCSNHQFNAVPGNILFRTQGGVSELGLQVPAVFLFPGFYGFIIQNHITLVGLTVYLDLAKTAVGKFHGLPLLLFGSCFYVVGGLLTLKISNKENENVTASILIWGTLVLFPISLLVEQPWNLSPRLDSTISLIYLGIFSTGIAWLLRFYILKHNGLVFQAQVAYLIPIFGVILGYLILNEAITSKVIISLIAVIIGIYIVKRGSKIIKVA